MAEINLSPRWSSRKFIWMVVLTILFTALLIYKHITETTFAGLMQVLLVAYFAANVWEKKL